MSEAGEVPGEYSITGAKRSAGGRRDWMMLNAAQWPRTKKGWPSVVGHSLRGLRFEETEVHEDINYSPCF